MQIINEKTHIAFDVLLFAFLIDALKSAIDRLKPLNLLDIAGHALLLGFHLMLQLILLEDLSFELTCNISFDFLGLF